MELLRWCSGKESACQYRSHERSKFKPWVGKIPRNRKWKLIPVFLARKSCGHRSLAGYSPSQKGCTLLNCWAHCRLVWVSTQLHCYLIHFIYVFTLRVITLLLYCRVHTLPKAVVFVFIFTVCPLYFSIFSWPSSFLYFSFGLPSFLPIFRSPSSNLYF